MKEVTFTVSALGVNVYIETKNEEFKKYNTQCSHSMLFATMKKLVRELNNLDECVAVDFEVE